MIFPPARATEHGAELPIYLNSNKHLLFNRENFKDLETFPSEKKGAPLKNLQEPGGPWRFVLHHDDRTVIYSLDPRFGLDDVNTLNLLTRPFLGRRIEGGVDETLPVLVITGREV